MAINFDFLNKFLFSGHLDYPFKSYGPKQVRLISTSPCVPNPDICQTCSDTFQKLSDTLRHHPDTLQTPLFYCNLIICDFHSVGSVGPLGAPGVWLGLLDGWLGSPDGRLGDAQGERWGHQGVEWRVGAGSCADIGAQCVQYALHIEFCGRWLMLFRWWRHKQLDGDSGSSGRLPTSDL